MTYAGQKMLDLINSIEEIKPEQKKLLINDLINLEVKMESVQARNETLQAMIQKLIEE